MALWKSETGNGSCLARHCSHEAGRKQDSGSGAPGCPEMGSRDLRTLWTRNLSRLFQANTTSLQSLSFHSNSPRIRATGASGRIPPRPVLFRRRTARPKVTLRAAEDPRPAPRTPAQGCPLCVLRVSGRHSLPGWLRLRPSLTSRPGRPPPPSRGRPEAPGPGPRPRASRAARPGAHPHPGPPPGPARRGPAPAAPTSPGGRTHAPAPHR